MPIHILLAAMKNQMIAKKIVGFDAEPDWAKFRVIPTITAHKTTPKTIMISVRIADCSICRQPEY